MMPSECSALAPLVPGDRVIVSESGIGGQADVLRLAERAARTFLGWRDPDAPARRGRRDPQATAWDVGGAVIPPESYLIAS
jgi:hypothetical protein